MAKKPNRNSPHPPGKCLFCGNTGLTRTHVWPDWLGRLVPSGTGRHEHMAYRDAPPATTSHIFNAKTRPRQGSIFSQKPFLACETCNTGWMANFENEMARFAKPLFTSRDRIIISYPEARIMSVWISLIVILAEHIKMPTAVTTISLNERQYVKKYLRPPDNWSIFYAGTNGAEWRQNYCRHCISVHYNDMTSSPITFAAYNTQITTLGIGNLFVQVFSCPVDRYVTDFRIAAKSRGLLQLWPIPGALWPFTKGSAKFPPTLVLDDVEADVLADAFFERLSIIFRHGHRRGPHY